MGDATRGLYRKFTVMRTDGKSEPGERHYQCRYFALDLTHDRFAPAAIRAYADACERDYPALAADLREWLLDQAGPREGGE